MSGPGDVPTIEFERNMLLYAWMLACGKMGQSGWDFEPAMAWAMSRVAQIRDDTEGRGRFTLLDTPTVEAYLHAPKGVLQGVALCKEAPDDPNGTVVSIEKYLADRDD